MLDQITPFILTYNEAANIRRTLERLTWARDIVVVDSFSEDETLQIVSGFPQARVFQRTFDNHAAQSNFALAETGISTDWILALDADFVLTPEVVEEIKCLKASPDCAGYSAQLVYCLHGQRLRSSLLPRLVTLYRKNSAKYMQDGHAHRVAVDGQIERLNSAILHDDRKPFDRWLESQKRYMALEAEKLSQPDAAEINFPDRVRRLRVVAPPAMLFYCLVVRGGVLDGRAGFYYAFQRMLAELLLSLYLLELDFDKATKPRLTINEREAVTPEPLRFS
jgi:glycosyltransferase involved in cell wall biosynthesis